MVIVEADFLLRNFYILPSIRGAQFLFLDLCSFLSLVAEEKEKESQL